MSKSISRVNDHVVHILLPPKADMIRRLRSVSTEKWRERNLFPYLLAEAGKSKNKFTLYTYLAAAFRLAAQGDDVKARELYAEMEQYVRVLVADPKKQGMMIDFVQRAKPKEINI